ncbi:hypothetical protein BDP27DRAFT_1336413 [Rhodocollybia butyracea]|uniref:Uncharacterized protein n=1 Tax=Rhodocollybia butyracea TaxID=206335 RepID=A0A9P5U0H8_9AGAR|nr:hypothetical protein BDP27DRAFT_1336413 [Rhodocollybia butyracea]
MPQSEHSQNEGNSRKNFCLAVQVEENTIHLNYELPPLVKALKKGFETFLTAACIVSVLLAATAATVSGTISRDTSLQTRRKDLLLALSYIAISFNISATINALCVMDRLAALPISARGRTGRNHLPELKSRPMTAILRAFDGKKGLMRFLYVSWMFSFSFGIIFDFLQLVLYAWNVETLGVKIAVTIAVIFSALPFVVYIFTHFLPKPTSIDSTA